MKEVGMQQVSSDTGSGESEISDESLPDQMEALVKEAAPGARLQTVPLPTIGPTDALVRVEAASICGTDLHIYRWDEWAQHRVHAPMVFGHEFAGEVVAVGSAATRVSPGAYVAAETHIACGECYECLHGLQHICKHVEIIGVDRPGAFAQYIAVPEKNLWLTDRRFPPQIATIQEPMGNAVHSALAAPIAGSTVAIFGAGPIGLFTVPISRAAGAARIITVEPAPFRRELARTMGSDVVIDPTSEDVVARLLEETGGEGVDVVLEMSGNGGAISQAFRALRYGGHASLLGIPSRPVEMDLADGVIFKGATVQGISGRRIWETWYQTRGFLESGMDLSPIITHVMPLRDFGRAFDLVATGQSGKVVLLPNAS
jgi:threonine 3-dehydrogenase